MISSSQNEVVKTLRRLRRERGDHCLLEGPHLLAEALASGLPLDTVVATDRFASSTDGHALLARLPRPPLAIEERLLAALSDADSPRGVLAVARLPRGGAENLPAIVEGLYLYLDTLQDPGNLGALARVAEAAGCTGIALAAGSVHPNHPRALRGSAGSLLRLPVAVGTTPADLTDRLRIAGEPRWAALVPQGGRDLWQADLGELSQQPQVLALGAEGPGLSAELAAVAEERITVSTADPVESLNATVAAALVLFERRRRIAALPRLSRPAAPAAAGRAGSDTPPPDGR